MPTGPPMALGMALRSPEASHARDDPRWDLPSCWEFFAFSSSASASTRLELRRVTDSVVQKCEGASRVMLKVKVCLGLPMRVMLQHGEPPWPPARIPNTMLFPLKLRMEVLSPTTWICYFDEILGPHPWVLPLFLSFRATIISCFS
jgi:hypothetical protein